MTLGRAGRLNPDSSLVRVGVSGTVADRVRAEGPLSAEQQREGATSRTALPINDCGGVTRGDGALIIAALPAGNVGAEPGPQSPSDDFGLIHALPMAVAFGLAFYAVIAALVLLK